MAYKTGLEEEPPEVFSCWQTESRPGRFHAVGMVQMFERGYVPFDQAYAEPPPLIPELHAWMAERGVELVELGIGPPHFMFPTAESALEFEKLWHNPGEVQAKARVAALRAQPSYDLTDRASIPS